MAGKVIELRRKQGELRKQREALIAEAQTASAADGSEDRSAIDNLIARAEDLQKQETAMQADIEREEKLALLGGNSQRSGEKPTSFIGMPEKDLRDYRITRAITALLKRDWRGAELEQEASEAVAKRLGRDPQGFFVPFDVQSQAVPMPSKRAMDTTTIGLGGVANMQSGSMIEALRDALVMRQVGATFLTDLVGNVQIPKMTTRHQWFWVGEGIAPTESNLVIGQVELTPKTIGAWSEFTRQLLAQTSLDIEGLVRNDIALALAEGIDYTALHGDSDANANSPDGIENITGVATPSGGLTWAGVVNLETAVAVANASGARMAYVTDAKARGMMKQTVRVASTDSRFIWNEDNTLNGYPAVVSNVVESNAGAGAESFMFFGNWSMLLIGSWGTIDILVDPYSQSTTGRTRVVAFMEADIAVRHAEGFGFTHGATS